VLESISYATVVKNHRKASFLLMLNREIHYGKARSIIAQARVSLLPRREIRAGFFSILVHAWLLCCFVLKYR